MIEIDGAIGGGSVLRVATGLAIATGQGIRVVNIRQQRRKPGLQAQHLAGLRAAAAYCDGQLTGDGIGSSQIEFAPGASRKEKLEVQMDTAGSVGLALQPLILATLRAETPLTVQVQGGGTFGLAAPPLPYVDRVFGAMLARFGRSVSLRVDRHGFYPQGGARVSAKLSQCGGGPVEAGERGKLLRVKGVSMAANHLKAARVALRQAQAATNRLLAELRGVRVDIRPDYADTRCPGSGIVVWAEFENTVLGASALGALGKRSETVGEEAAEALLAEVRADGTVDSHMSDQLIPVVALLGGRFRAPEMTEHVAVNLAIVRQMLGRSLESGDRWIG